MRALYNLSMVVIPKIGERYLQEVELIYGNTSYYDDILGNPEHIRCKLEIEAAIDPFINAIAPLEQLFDDYLAVDTFTDKLAKCAKC